MRRLRKHSKIMANYGPAIVSQCSKRAFGSHPCRVISVSYEQMGCCHGRGLISLTSNLFCTLNVLHRRLGLETSRPRGSYRVALIAFPNVLSFTRYGWLVLGKFDHFTAPVVGYRLDLCWKEISSIKFDHFRHNIILFTRISQSCLKSADLFDAV